MLRPALLTLVLSSGLAHAAGPDTGFRLSFQIADADLAAFTPDKGLAPALSRCQSAGFARVEAVGAPETFCIEPNMAWCSLHLVTQTYRCLP